jgi:hypothetical protein
MEAASSIRDGGDTWLARVFGFQESHSRLACRMQLATHHSEMLERNTPSGDDLGVAQVIRETVREEE